MKKEIFYKLKEQLADLYSKDELLGLLMEHRDRRISSLICAAYNSKCSIDKKSQYEYYLPQYDGRFTQEVELAFKLYEQKRSAIGDGSWYYSLLERSTWDKYEKKVKSLGLDPEIRAKQVFKLEKKKKK